MAVRDRRPASLAPRGPAAEPRHLGRRAGLVDEDEFRRVEVELPLGPGLAPLQDVRTVLLGGVRRLDVTVVARRPALNGSAALPLPLAAR